MQANGDTLEAASNGGTGGGGGSGSGGDDLPDIASVSGPQLTGPSLSQSQQQQALPGHQQHQHHLRSSASPGHQMQQHQHQMVQQQLGAPVVSNHHMGSGGLHQHQQQHHHHHQHHLHHVAQQHHQPGAYHQRHAQTYHNQQMQHYHHQNKYHNNPRGDSGTDNNVNHVLLITVINPHHTITCDLIHQICSNYGKVNRIVIFKKNGVQAMVEFDNVESAKRAKAMLYGCDIYSGCCTLRIEYAKPTRLNIHKNDQDSFDYTNPNLASGPDTSGSSGQLNEHIISNADGSHSDGHQVHHPTHGPHQQTHGIQQSRSGLGIGGGGGGKGGSSSSGHHHGAHHFHSSHHHQHHQHPQSSTPHQHHVQPTQPPPLTQSVGSTGPHGPATTGYGLTTVLDQPAITTDAFHQDAGGFNGSRGGGGGGPPGSYVGVDSYMPAHQGSHGLHGSMYSRQDGHQHQHHQHHPHHQHHQHHQHHHSRSSIGVGAANHGSSFSSANTSNPVMLGHSNHHLASPQGTVMMVYGLQSERLNCDRLFNLFCLYGNVVRVKFLRTMDGCAMVQMGDVLAVDRCVSSLHKITLFGSELQLSYSKQAFLHDVIQPFILPDGSPSFKDFMGNKNNRFKNPEVASKNRILPPSQVLHFFSAPFGITEEELVHLFKHTAGHEPVNVKIFTPKTDNNKSYSGLVTFKDPAEATETLVMCNHLSLPKPGAPHPFILRLCFSPPTYNRGPSANYASPNQ